MMNYLDTDDYYKEKEPVGPSTSPINRFSYQLLSEALKIKGYSERDRFHSRKTPTYAITQWYHAKDVDKPDIFITINLATKPFDDTVIGIAVGVDKPSSEITTLFLKGL